MTGGETILIAAMILVAAMLYSSVGHGGASGYLAVLALFSVSPVTMRPTVLVLNICVSSIAAYRFASKGFFSWKKFYPFAIASVPLAFIGGRLILPTALFKPILGIALLLAAVFLARKTATSASDDSGSAHVPFFYALLCGGILGLLSGLTGVGGGIFLSPILLFAGWADVRQTAATSAVFILVNSIAGLVANLGQTDTAALPAWPVFAAFALAAVAGGMIGSSFGSNKHRSSLTLRRVLALVLTIAAVKLIIG